jgi:hypothetical protein
MNTFLLIRKILEKSFSKRRNQNKETKERNQNKETKIKKNGGLKYFRKIFQQNLQLHRDKREGRREP